MKKIVLFAILFNIELCVKAENYESCPNANITNSSGRISYRKKDIDETCYWNFTLPNGSSDFVMIYDLFYYDPKYSSGDTGHTFLMLPNETRLQISILYYNVTPCKIYYNEAKKPSDCLFNITKLYCSQMPIGLKRWPPRMQTRSGDLSFRFGLTYHLLPYLVGNTLANIDCKQNKTITKDSSPKKEMQQLPQYIAIIILALLLLLAIIAGVVLFIKLRGAQKAHSNTLNQHQESQHNQNPKIQNNQHMIKNETYEEIEPTHSQSNNPDSAGQGDEAQMVVNVLYCAH